MSRFVQIRASAASGGDADLLFDGVVQSLGSGLVGREVLFDLASEQAVAELQDYPRLMEPTLTLLVRLIRAAPAGSFLYERFVAGMVLTLHIRPKRNLLMSSDILHITRNAGEMSIHLLSPVCIAAGFRIPIPRSLNVSTAIHHAVRGALGWRRRIPLMPLALTKIPIHRNAGDGAYVQLADVPLMPRRQLQKVLGIGEGSERVDAVLWSTFLWSLRARIRSGRATK